MSNFFLRLSCPLALALSFSIAGQAENFAFIENLETSLSIYGAGESIALWQETHDDKTWIESSSFDATQNRWLEGVKISPNGSTSAKSQIKIAANLAVWNEVELDKKSTINSSTYSDGKWSTPVVISSGETTDKELPDIAGSYQMAVAVWQESQDSQHVIMSSHYLPSEGWSVPVAISSKDADAVFPHIALDSEGNAMAIWIDNKSLNVQSAYKSSSGWGTPVNLAKASKNGAKPQVAMEPYGDVLAAWGSGDGADFKIQVATGSSSNWDQPIDLTPKGVSVDSIKVLINGNKSGLVAWSQQSSDKTIATSSIYASYRLPAHVNFSSAYKIGNGTSPEVVFSPAGQAIAVWDGIDGTIKGAFLKVSFDEKVASTWSKPLTLSNVGEKTRTPKVVVDLNGNAMINWVNDDLKAIEYVEWNPVPFPKATYYYQNQ